MVLSNQDWPDPGARLPREGSSSLPPGVEEIRTHMRLPALSFSSVAGGELRGTHEVQDSYDVVAGKRAGEGSSLTIPLRVTGPS